MGEKYIDEKLAKARRRYIEDMINQRQDKGVWKGKVYSMIPYTMYQFYFRVNVPDFLLQVLHEDLAAANGLDSPFACMADCSHVSRQLTPTRTPHGSCGDTYNVFLFG